MKKVLEIGGFIAGAILVVFGIVAIVLALNGQSTVNSSLKSEKITGSSDMTPAAIKQEVAGFPVVAGLVDERVSCSSRRVRGGEGAGGGCPPYAGDPTTVSPRTAVGRATVSSCRSTRAPSSLSASTLRGAWAFHRNV
jgi:hypothetical protein